MEPIVRFEAVTKAYGKSVAVDALDLDIAPGEFVTLLGPSGCGKSTTLRMLGGFETPNSGRILLAGRDVTRLPPNKRDVNIVFQDYALFPHMTIAKNIAFGLELKGIESAAIHRRVGELLDLVQLGDYAARMPHELSGGQRQRVALIRALAPDPQILLLDEPLSALDAKLRGQMQMELKAIQQRTGKSFLFVTHDQEEALTMSDRIVVMNAGRIEQMGTPEELYGRPASRFVASFIGDTNLLDCSVVSADGPRVALDWQGVAITAARGETSPAPGTRARLAVRPEAIRLFPAEPDTANRVRGRVSRRVFKGNHALLSVEVEGRGQIEALVDPLDLAVPTEGEVWLGWRAENAVVLRD